MTKRVERPPEPGEFQELMDRCRDRGIPFKDASSPAELRDRLEAAAKAEAEE